MAGDEESPLVGVGLRLPNRIVVIDGEMGERVVRRRLERVPDGLAFRQSDGDWWLFGGEKRSRPTF